LEYLLAGAVMYGAKKAYGKKKKHDAWFFCRQQTKMKLLFCSLLNYSKDLFN
jgi:hypothetical protein